MIRHCDGNDPNLIMYVAAGPRTDNSPEPYEEWKAIPCNCGKVFDDVKLMVIYPHESIK